MDKENYLVCAHARLCLHVCVCLYFTPYSDVHVCALRCLCVCGVFGGWRRGGGRWTGQIPTHNLNLIGPGLTGWGQNEEKISHINQDKIIS